MTRLPGSSRAHDPYWGMDGPTASHARLRRTIVRRAGLLLLALVVVGIATRLPAIDATAIVTGYGKPILAGAIVAVLGAAVLLALARLRVAHRSH